MEQPSPVRMKGPLAPYQDALRAQLLARGYAPFSAQNLIGVAAHLSRWLEELERSPVDLNAAQLEEFLQHRRARGYTCWLTLKGLTPILDALRLLEVVPPVDPPVLDDSPAAQLLRDFERHLLEERGIRSATAAGYVRHVQPFVDSLRLSDLSDLERVSPALVSDFILRKARSLSIGYAKLVVTALRAFLRYLHLRGFCRDLAAAVPAVAGFRLSGLPKAVPEEAVRRLEKSCDRQSAVGRRDYAILLLFSRLGLRAAEVAKLELNDVRWSQGEIWVRGKGSEGLLPLPHEVGEALADYLKHARPVSPSRRLFLQVVAPHRELTAGAATAIVRNASRKAGLPFIGSHRLRHTAATVMLRRGASLPEIAQVLRHGSLLTTAIYAKVDDLALRPLARPWPGGVA